jgi:hypothetical protein
LFARFQCRQTYSREGAEGNGIVLRLQALLLVSCWCEYIRTTYNIKRRGIRDPKINQATLRSTSPTIRPLPPLAALSLAVPDLDVDIDRAAEQVYALLVIQDHLAIYFSCT